MESEVANSALAGKLIEEDDVEMRLERVSASCLDEKYSYVYRVYAQVLQP